MAEAEEYSVRYAAFRLRFRALLIDAAIALALFATLAVVAGTIFQENASARVALFIAAVVFFVGYEPIMVAVAEGTIGHHLANLRVTRAGHPDRLPFWRALIRWVAKHPLGLFSFAFMFVTKRAQSLHDLAAGSAVRIRNPRLARRHDYFVPAARDEHFVQLPLWRRTLVTLAYLSLFWLASIIGTVLSVSPQCAQLDECTASEDGLETLLGGLLLAGSATLMVLGSSGRLIGARRRPRVQQDVATDGASPRR